MDQPRLVVDMLYRVPSLRTPKGVDRATVQKEEAQELLLLISKESFRDPRILCRCEAPHHLQIFTMHDLVRNAIHQ